MDFPELVQNPRFREFLRRFVCFTLEGDDNTPPSVADLKAATDKGFFVELLPSRVLWEGEATMYQIKSAGETIVNVYSHSVNRQGQRRSFEVKLRPRTCSRYYEPVSSSVKRSVADGFGYWISEANFQRAVREFQQM